MEKNETALEWKGFIPFHLVSLSEMIQNYAQAFYNIGETVTRIITITNLENVNKSELLATDIIVSVREQLAYIENWCTAAKLNMSAISAKRIGNQDDAEFVIGKLSNSMGELQRRIEDEFTADMFFHVPREKCKYYQQEDLFGELVAKNFPSASFDIDEAGKCIALGRPTACAMHLMRIVELGLQVLAQRLEIPNTPSWDGILGKIDAEIPKRYKPSEGWNTKEAEFFTDAARHLRTYIKARNRTQHFEKKYTDEEAIRMFDAVCELMQHLATELKEVWVPLPPENIQAVATSPTSIQVSWDEPKEEFKK